MKVALVRITSYMKQEAVSVEVEVGEAVDAVHPALVQYAVLAMIHDLIHTYNEKFGGGPHLTGEGGD